MTENISTGSEQKLEFKVNNAWDTFAKKNSWAVFIPEFANDLAGQGFMRPLGRSIVYRISSQTADGKQTYACVDCNSQIVGATVAHPIWDGPFPCSGSGNVEYEQVPYCPKCETTPASHGMPITRR